MLNPVEGTVVGPALSLKVSPGDSIRLQVKASYEEGSSAQPEGMEALAATLASALGATPPAGLETVGAAPEALSQALAGTALLDDDGSGVPNAYLNYLLFDTAYHLLDQGFVKISQAAKITVGGKGSNS